MILHIAEAEGGHVRRDDVRLDQDGLGPYGGPPDTQPGSYMGQFLMPGLNPASESQVSIENP